MKLKRIIHSVLIISILFNNTNNKSLANEILESECYETFQGDSIFIDNILETNNHSISIQGNTLVNLLKREGGFYNIDDYSNAYSYNPRCIDNQLIFTSQYDALVRPHGVDGKVRIKHKKNKFYTVIYTTKTSNLDTQSFIRILSSNNRDVVATSNPSSCLEYTTYTFLITPDMLLNYDDFYLYYRGNTSSEGEVYFKDVMVLEGDWTNKKLPKYFEGIKSVGQDSDGINNLEVLKKNKNLYRHSLNKDDYIFYDVNKDLFNIDSDGVVTVNYAYGNGHTFASKNLIECKESTNYTISAEILSNTPRFGLRLLKKDGSIYDNNDIKDWEYNIWYKAHYSSYYKPKVISIPKDVAKIQIMFIGDEAGDYSFKNFQIEEGSIYTGYSNYDLSFKNLILNNPLRGIDNKVIDKIIKRNNQWVVERNLGEIYVNGDENWHFADSSNNGNTTTTFYMALPDSKRDYGYTKSDSINEFSSDFNYNKEIEGLTLGFSTSNLFIRVKNNRLETVDVDGFKKWLSNNPVNVVYELNNSKYESLNDNLDIDMYFDKTYIEIDSIIPCTIKISIDRTINKAIEAIQLAQENPTIDNISKARMWINLLKESTNKDNLQSQIDNIIEIKDFEIELKKVTSNMDVYIKSQNGLSITLSTNSIIFDEFDSTEDMEKLNAVNLTVNSSLPYQLNTYMMTEFKNKDNTEIIPKELFNIRLSGETDYKAFSNINEKLVLKENCQKGNNNQFNIDLILKGSLTHKADVYKTTIKFEAEQK